MSDRVEELEAALAAELERRDALIEADALDRVRELTKRRLSAARTEMQEAQDEAILAGGHSMDRTDWPKVASERWLKAYGEANAYQAVITRLMVDANAIRRQV